MDTSCEDISKIDCRPTYTEEFPHPVLEHGRYAIPWSDWRRPKISWKLIKFLTVTKKGSNIPSQDVLDVTLPVMKPDLSQFSISPCSGVRHMWIGHATSLVQLDGVTFLTDPIFSVRASPAQWVGYKRYRPPPCTIEELPQIDCVIISHNHYDHLDYRSVVGLNKRFGDNLRWYVPMGLKQWIKDSGCNNVIELSWWQEHVYSEESQVKFVSTPCQHWCKRTLTDDNKVLWTSWCVIGPNHKFYFAGDTGYCPVFKDIGRKYGPFTLATIPIGAYNPRWYLSPQHVDPSEAVDIHRDVRSQASVGIHWGTFALGYEFYLEPRERIKEELEQREMNPSSFITVSHGEVTVFGDHPDPNAMTGVSFAKFSSSV